MSTGLFDSNRFFTPTTKTVAITWAAIFVVGFVVYRWWDRSSAVSPTDDGAPQNLTGELSTRNGSNPPVWTGVGAKPTEAPSPNKRLDELERTLGNYDRQFRQLQTSSSVAESGRAIERAQTAALAAQIKSSRERVQKLKALDAAWQAKAPSLMTDDSGRRITASPPHLAIALGVLERDRPTSEQLLQWELQLEELATPVERVTQDKDSLISLTPEHVKILTDLGLQLTRSLAEVEQQQLLIEELVKETASIDPGTNTLQAIVRDHRAAEEKARAERIAAARQAARAEAEKLQIEQLTKLERELVEAETRVKEAERRATIAGLNDQAANAEAALKELEEERAFERALPQIKAALGSFITPGFTLRNDKVKGPASLSFIEGSGALAATRPGMESLVYLAAVQNDRTLVGLPKYVGGDFGWSTMPKEPVEKAQALLTKWGTMMVKKGLLAP